ncbi:MAG: hypothetical protein ACYDDB_03530 [bacterium]
MKFKNFIEEIKKDKDLEEIKKFFEERFLGEVLSLDDFIGCEEEIESEYAHEKIKSFLRFFEKEKKLIGTKNFLSDPEYPAPNYAGFKYLEPENL